MKAYAKSDVKSLMKTKNSGTDKQSGKNKIKIKKRTKLFKFQINGHWCILIFGDSDFDVSYFAAHKLID